MFVARVSDTYDVVHRVMTRSRCLCPTVWSVSSGLCAHDGRRVLCVVGVWCAPSCRGELQEEGVTTFNIGSGCGGHDGP